MYSITLQVSRSEPFRCHSGGVIEHFNEARALQGKDTEFGKQLLLTNAQTAVARLVKSSD